MAQPHKGDRTLIISRPRGEVVDAVKAAAASYGLSVSQYVADVLAAHVGRPDLVREHSEVLPLAM